LEKSIKENYESPSKRRNRRWRGPEGERRRDLRKSQSGLGGIATSKGERVQPAPVKKKKKKQSQLPAIDRKKRRRKCIFGREQQIGGRKFKSTGKGPAARLIRQREKRRGHASSPPKREKGLRSLAS